MIEKTIKGRKLLRPGSEYPRDNALNGGGTLVGHLKGLISLQTCDSRILDIRRRIERGPAKIKELEQELTLVEERLRGDVDQIEESKRQRRKAEQGIDDLEARIAKSNTKLSLIKSNKEYTAALKEIDDLGREKSLLEDTVLEMMEQVEGLEKGLAETKAEIAEQKDRVQQEKEKIAAQVKALEVELEALESQRANLCGANLGGAYLGGAYLGGASLSEAVLKEARVTDEQLAQAESLEGVTMPDGTKHD